MTAELIRSLSLYTTYFYHIAGLSGCGDELLPEVENRDREELKVDVEDQGKIRYGVWVSFAEIYNEQIFDLLEAMPGSRSARRQALKICDDKTGNPYIKGKFLF